MAQKGKNENLKDRARERSKKRRPKESTGTSMDCGHSTDILPYLLNPPTGPSSQGVTDNSRYAKLRRLFKKEFGYKPTGISEGKLEVVLREHSVKKYGDGDYIFRDL